MNNQYRSLFSPSPAIAAVLALCAISSLAQNVNVTGILTYVAGAGGVYDYTLTLSNSGPEAVKSLWVGWIPGVFDIVNASNPANNLGWSSSVDGQSLQYLGGTPLASGATGIFTFDSTSTPAQFMSDAAGDSTAYGVNAANGQLSFSLSGADTEEFNPTVVSNSPPGATNSTPVITAQPQSQTVFANTTVMFSVTASNAISYQWESNMVALAGATNASLVLSNVVIADSASYQVVVTGATNSVTSSNAVLLVLTVAAPVLITQPQSTNAITNTTVTFSITASNAASYQWESNMVDLPGATNASLILSNVVIGDSGSYQVVISNASGSVTSFNAVLLVGYPASFTRELSNVNVSAGTPVTLQVEAAGSPAPQYQWFLNNSKLPGQTNTTLALGTATTNIDGAYFVIVSNIFGSQTSSNAVLTVEPLTSIIKEKLMVTINPARSGSISPNFNDKSLLVAHSYTVTAVAARGQAFANWTGVVQSDDPSVTFVMPNVSNATLTANFIPSPFASNEVAGAYAGLFLDTNNLSNEASGYFAATVADGGVISGQVKIAGVSTSFSTILRADGSATLDLKRHNLSTLVLTLQADLSGLETLTGTIGDTSNTFNARLAAYRAGFSASHHAATYDGYYTWAMPGGAENASTAPAGYSYGTATIAATGGVRLTIFLSDGTSTTVSGSLSTNGQIPLYVSLYGGKGSLLSWLSFTNSPGNLSTNGAYWFKGQVSSPSTPAYNPYRSPESVAKDSYTDGFTLTNLMLLMGAYTAEARGTNALNAASVSVQLSGADLTSSKSNTIALNASGIGGSSATTTVNISDKTGLFSGSFKDPISAKTVHFKGAVLHALPAGYGFFTSDELSGAVLIEPQ